MVESTSDVNMKLCASVGLRRRWYEHPSLIGDLMDPQKEKSGVDCSS